METKNKNDSEVLLSGWCGNEGEMRGKKTRKELNSGTALERSEKEKTIMFDKRHELNSVSKKSDRKKPGRK